MLVYLREPMGYSQVGDKRVYGRSYCRGRFGPTDIAEEEWKKEEDKYIHAEYTKEWLENKFKRTFPTISFTIDTLKDMDDRTIKNLAVLVGINFKDKWGAPHLDRIGRNALIKSITWALNKE